MNANVFFSPSWLRVALFVIFGFPILPLASAAISIDFAGSNTTPMASSETAGVVAKTNWNTCHRGNQCSVAETRRCDRRGYKYNSFMDFR